MPYLCWTFWFEWAENADTWIIISMFPNANTNWYGQKQTHTFRSISDNVPYVNGTYLFVISSFVSDMYVSVELCLFEFYMLFVRAQCWNWEFGTCKSSRMSYQRSIWPIEAITWKLSKLQQVQISYSHFDYLEIIF